MIEIVEFHVEHIQQMQARWVFEGDPWMEDNCKVLSQSPNSLVKTLKYRGHIIGVVGLSLFWPGVALVWTVLSERIKQCPIAFHKTVKRLLDFAIVNLKLWRVQMDVRADFPQGHRWAESLGFKKECIMKKYGPTGVDHILYARVV